MFSLFDVSRFDVKNLVGHFIHMVMLHSLKVQDLVITFPSLQLISIQKIPLLFILHKEKPCISQ